MMASPIVGLFKLSFSHSFLGEAHFSSRLSGYRLGSAAEHPDRDDEALCDVHDDLLEQGNTSAEPARDPSLLS
jgi:hypothetical protein